MSSKVTKNSKANKVSVGIELSGFDVEVAGVNFFFSTAESNIERFLEFAKNPEAYVDKVQALSDEVDLTEKEYETAEDLPSVDEYREFVGVQKEALTIMYDIMLGEGAFDKLYEKYPDAMALANIIEAVIETIFAGLEMYSATQTLKQKKQAAKRAADRKTKKKNKRV